MAYADIYAAANDAAFQGRCLVAMWTAAQNITTEDPATASHQQRADWANTVLQDRAAVTSRQLAMQVLRNTSIAASPTASSDADIQFQVNSVLAALVALG